MTAEDRRSRSTEAFFGRRRGKTIRPLQAAALEKGLPIYRIDLDALPPAPLEALFPAKVSSIRLEIGFGGGEHLMKEAGRLKSTGFIGVEPFVNGMARMMSALADAPLPNLRVYDDDATRLLDWLPEASLSGIDLLYPDPWPKKKHWKRRFIGAANLQRFARVLKKGGSFRFASDIDSYVNWTLLACSGHGGFEWSAREANDWRRPFRDWAGTRYEAKALREGRKPAYLTFVRA